MIKMHSLKEIFYHGMLDQIWQSRQSTAKWSNLDTGVNVLRPFMDELTGSYQWSTMIKSL
jgi:hypothetical protein